MHSYGVCTYGVYSHGLKLQDPLVACMDMWLDMCLAVRLDVRPASAGHVDVYRRSVVVCTQFRLLSLSKMPNDRVQHPLVVCMDMNLDVCLDVRLDVAITI